MKYFMEEDENTGARLFPSDGPSHRFDDSKISTIRIEKHEQERIGSSDNIANIIAKMNSVGLRKEALDVLAVSNALPNNGYWDDINDKLLDEVRRLEENE